MENKYELQANLYENYLKRLENCSCIVDLHDEYKKLIVEINQSSENPSLALKVLQTAYEIKFYEIYCYSTVEYENLEIFEIYNKILDEMVLLSNQLGLTNSLEYSILFTILGYNGFLSNSKIFYYDDTEEYPEGLKAAFSIFSGVGVCRHLSD